jgi:Reverse transcriptase (RNA-dependent DNA polymerase)
LKNWTLTRALRDTTLYEARTGTKPDLSSLREFGCKAYVWAPGDKIGLWATEGYWVGFDPQTADGYRIYWPEKQSVTVERNVTFDPAPRTPTYVDLPTLEGERESKSSLVENEGLDDVASIQNAKGQPPLSAENVTKSATKADENSPGISSKALAQPIRRSERIRKPTEYMRRVLAGEGTTEDEGSHSLPTGLPTSRIDLGDGKPAATEEANMFWSTDKVAMAAAMTEAEGLEPCDIHEARKRPDWPKWEEAMIDELGRLKHAETWEPIEKPKGVNVIGSKWVYQVKKNSAGEIDKYRARLVAQGYSQIPGIAYDDTFAPIVKTSSIWVVLSFAACYGWPAHQMDVKSTYLNRKLEDSEDLYLQQPPGYAISGSEHLVLWLKKAIYGLKQSGRCWYKIFSDILKQIGLNPCESDSAIFIRHSKDQGITILMAHVDDLTLVASSMDLVNALKRDLKSKLEMTDIGELYWLLGIEIKWDPENTPFPSHNNPTSNPSSIAMDYPIHVWFRCPWTPTTFCRRTSAQQRHASLAKCEMCHIAKR